MIYSTTTNIKISSDHIWVSLKKETLDHLRTYLESQGEIYTIDKIDDAIQEWVNWQIKAAQEEAAP